MKLRNIYRIPEDNKQEVIRNIWISKSYIKKCLDVYPDLVFIPVPNMPKYRGHAKCYNVFGENLEKLVVNENGIIKSDTNFSGSKIFGIDEQDLRKAYTFEIIEDIQEDADFVENPFEDKEEALQHTLWAKMPI